MSHHISTAGYEASARANMQFMMNGALRSAAGCATIGDGARGGRREFLLFGLTAEQVADSQGGNKPALAYEHDPETRAAWT